MKVRTIINMHLLPNVGDCGSFHMNVELDEFDTTAETDEELRMAAIERIGSYVSIQTRNGWLADKLVMCARPTQLLLDDNGLFREIAF